MSNAVIGEHVYVIGFPGSVDDGKGHLTVTDGVYTGAQDGYMQRITAFGYYGNSGGGAWNDRGELIGIVVEIRPTDSTYDDSYPVPFPASTYMVPVKYVRDTLKELSTK
jgi:S1-C subfamily serine protease